MDRYQGHSQLKWRETDCTLISCDSNGKVSCTLSPQTPFFNAESERTVEASQLHLHWCGNRQWISLWKSLDEPPVELLQMAAYWQVWAASEFPKFPTISNAELPECLLTSQSSASATTGRIFNFSFRSTYILLVPAMEAAAWSPDTMERTRLEETAGDAKAVSDLLSSSAFCCDWWSTERFGVLFSWTAGYSPLLNLSLVSLTL